MLNAGPFKYEVIDKKDVPEPKLNIEPEVITIRSILRTLGPGKALKIPCKSHVDVLAKRMAVYQAVAYLRKKEGRLLSLRTEVVEEELTGRRLERYTRSPHRGKFPQKSDLYISMEEKLEAKLNE